MADSQFGGRVSITAGGLKLSPTDAAIKLKTSQVSKEAKANQDGSACYMLKAVLQSAEFSFRRPLGVDWTTLMLQGAVDVTIVEEDNGRTHLFSGTQFTGDPDESLTDGEVTGLKAEGGRYTRIRQA